MTTYTICKEFHFAAAHVLDGLEADHPCSRMHGHNYVAVVELQGDQLDATGMVLDYRRLTPFKRWLDEQVDHRVVNELPAFEGVNPTAENMARVLYDQVRTVLPNAPVTAVRVHETPKTMAEYRP